MPPIVDEVEIVRKGDGFSDWIDRELCRHATSFRYIPEPELNSLLELRDLMRVHHGMDPASVVREFFRLRICLEESFYLLCYRLRNWLTIHYEIEIKDPLERVKPVTESLDLRFRNFGELLDSVRQRYCECSNGIVSISDLRISVSPRK